MKRSRWVAIPAFVVALSVLTVRAAPDAGIAVADFAYKVLHAMGQRPANAVAAVRTLEQAGVDLGKDASARLTWDRAASILRDLGVQVAAPTNPTGQVSSGMAAQIVRSVAMEHNGGHWDSHHHNGGENCPPSPSSPGDCDDDHDHDHDGDHDGDHNGDHDGDQGGDHDGDHNGGHGDHD
jgi:hypothetical protein